jgi:hypothetical protein
MDSLRYLLVIGLIVIQNMGNAATLSETYLTKQEQESYFDYRIDVAIQRGDTGNWNIPDNHPNLYAQFLKTVQSIEKLQQKGVNWQNVTEMLKSAEREPLHLGWSDTVASNFSHYYPWVVPIIHHKGDLTIDQTIELDYPLLVEGNLQINGNLVMQHEHIPLIVTGNLNAHHLLYDISKSKVGHLFVKQKLTLSGYAFIEGKTKYFDHNLSAKQIFSLSTYDFCGSNLGHYISGIECSESNPNPQVFPDDPSLTRPSILAWEEELDTHILGEYLLHDLEPFAYAFTDKQQEQPWSLFFNAWKKFAKNQWSHPEIFGAKKVNLKSSEFSKANRKILEKAEVSSLDVWADGRTGRGFYSINHDLFPNACIEDPEAYEKKFGKPLLDLYLTMAPDQYTSTCRLAWWFGESDFTNLLHGDLDSPSYFPYSLQGIGDEQQVNQRFIQGKHLLDKDPYLAMFWLLRFGLTFDERYDEVLKLAKTQDNAQLKSAISFFEQGAYQQVSAYAGRILEFDTLLTEDGQPRLSSGKEAFQQFHSDYIYSYYSNNDIRNANTIKALRYAIEHDFMGETAIDKAKLLVEIAEKNKLWSEISIIDKPQRNELAWKYILLHHPKNKISDVQRANWQRSIQSYQEKRTPQTDKFWEIINTTKPESDTDKAAFSAKLLAGQYFEAVKQLQTRETGITLLYEFTYDVLNYINQHRDDKLEANQKALLFFIEIATENQISTYYLHDALSLLEVNAPNRLRTWIYKKLQKPRLRWADHEYNYDEIGGVKDIVTILNDFKFNLK